MRTHRPAAALLAAATLLLAAGVSHGQPDPAEGGRLTAGGRPIAWRELARRARAARLVYVGEEHGTPADHLLQRDLLLEMADAGPVVLGCEYFPRSLQPALDRFNRGEVGIEGFRELVEWEKTWGHAWESYAPLFRAAAARRVPIVALNAEKLQVQAVRRGGLASLPLEDLAALPSIDLRCAPHRERVTAQLLQVHPMPPEVLERYYQAFTVWDECMAQGVADVLLRDRRPDLRVLVVAGRAHIESGTGIPDRVQRRVDLPRLVVVCDGSGEAEPGLGDVIFTTHRPQWF